MNQKIKKRHYLVAHLDELLDALSYYKMWNKHLRDREGLVIWKHGEPEGRVSLK